MRRYWTAKILSGVGPRELGTAKKEAAECRAGARRSQAARTPMCIIVHERLLRHALVTEHFRGATETPGPCIETPAKLILRPDCAKHSHKPKSGIIPWTVLTLWTKWTEEVFHPPGEVHWVHKVNRVHSLGRKRRPDCRIQDKFAIRGDIFPVWS